MDFPQKLDEMKTTARLTPSCRYRTEYRLLEFLMRRAGQVVTRTMIVNSLRHSEAEDNTLDAFVSMLRGKVDRGYRVMLLQTVRGKGYFIRGDQAEDNTKMPGKS